MIELRGLVRFAAISVLAALVTIGLKGGAYLLTGSVGLLSDALESFVNLIAAVVALIALSVAARPPTRSTPTVTPRPSTSPAGSRVRSSWSRR